MVEGQQGKSVAISGDAVRRFRQARFLTQAVLAQRVGMSLNTIKRIEQSNANVHVGTVVALADALLVEPGSLLKKLRVGVDWEGEVGDGTAEELEDLEEEYGDDLIVCTALALLASLQPSVREEWVREVARLRADADVYFSSEKVSDLPPARFLRSRRQLVDDAHGGTPHRSEIDRRVREIAPFSVSNHRSMLAFASAEGSDLYLYAPQKAAFQIADQFHEDDWWFSAGYPEDFERGFSRVKIGRGRGRIADSFNETTLAEEITKKRRYNCDVGLLPKNIEWRRGEIVFIDDKLSPDVAGKIEPAKPKPGPNSDPVRGAANKAEVPNVRNTRTLSERAKRRRTAEESPASAVATAHPTSPSKGALRITDPDAAAEITASEPASKPASKASLTSVRRGKLSRKTIDPAS